MLLSRVHCDNPANDESNRERWEYLVEKLEEQLKTKVKIESNGELKLYHGLKLTSSTSLLERYADICFCSETQEYLLLNPEGTVVRFTLQGNPIQPALTLAAGMNFTRMLWCPEIKVLVGYTPMDDIIWMLTSGCLLYQIVRNDFRAQTLFYEPVTREIIVVGPDRATRYPVGKKEQTLNPWKSVSYSDLEMGPAWHIQKTALIPQSTSLLRLAGSYLTTLYVMPLDPEKDKGESSPLNFLSRKTQAMQFQITGLCYSRISCWIITGDSKGNVVSWDLALNPIMLYPEAHEGSVNYILDHPCIAGFVTSGGDNVLQVWSSNLRDKVERFDGLGEIWCASLNESAAAIATLGEKLCCFNMCQLYSFYSPLTSPLKLLSSTRNPMYPMRVLAASSDNNVRILSAASGNSLNVQILPTSLEIIDVAYNGSTDSLYTILLRTGEILVSDTLSNPMKYKHVWVNDEVFATCIIVYEHFEEIRGLKRNNERMLHYICSHVIIGTNNGSLVMVEQNSGKYQDTFPAHKGPVIMLDSSSTSRKVISVGEDKQVKVWTIFPDIPAPLALAYTLYFSEPIMHVATMGSVLCIVKASTLDFYPVLMYDTMTQERMVHHYTKDHQSLVTSMTTSDSILLCATAAADTTIRLWDRENKLIRILEINVCPLKITFSSLRGDIVFGAAKHLFKIPHENYLPPKYISFIMTELIPENIREDTIPESVDYKIYEDECDRKIILHTVSSTPLGTLTPGASDVPSMEAALKKFACAQLQFRDEDIMRLKNGLMKKRKLVPDKAKMTTVEWKKFLEEIKPEGEEVLDGFNIFQFVDRFKDVRRISNESEIQKLMDGDMRKYIFIPNFGFLANSILYKIYVEELRLKSTEKIRKLTIKYKYPQEILDLSKKEESSAFLIAPELLELQAQIQGT